MKIGILTYQYAINYGAVLQAYALKKYLEQKGNEVEILNYDTSYLYLKKRSIKAKMISGAWGIVKNLLGAKKKKYAFEEFRKNRLQLKDDIISSHTVLEKYTEDSDFDAYIVGSDQVWNNKINGKDKAYYLDFAKDKLKIAYAASMGVSKMSVEELEEICADILRFDAISVREKTALKLLEANIDKNRIKVVLDPVFLPNFEVWDNLSKERIIDEPYILCYVMPGDKVLENRITEIASRLKKQHGLRIVYVGRKEFCQFKNDGLDMISTSPEEFLKLIRYAEYVVTNSFHGTAFSIIFSKQFYSLTNENLTGEKQLGSRIIDLLEQLELLNRVCSSESLGNLNEIINYEKVKPKLNCLIDNSKQFLENVFKA